MATKRVYSGGDRKRTLKSINGTKPNLSNLPIASLDAFTNYKKDKSGLKEVNLPEIGGKVWCKPLSSAKYRDLIKVTDLGELCHEAATFMSENVFLDDLGEKYLCDDYSFWMNMTPGQLNDIFNYIGNCLQDGGDEKNA